MAGKGFEGMVVAVAKGLGVAENAIRDVAYGKANGNGGVKFPGNKKKTNGLLPILREINKIDLCNVINYVLGNISLVDGKLGEKLNEIRDAAKSLLDLLEGGLLVNPTVISAEEVAVLIGLLQTLDNQIDSDVVALFPKVQAYKNDINNLVGVLIHYNAAVASYEVLKKAVDEANANNPDAVTTGSPPTVSKVLITTDPNNPSPTSPADAALAAVTADPGQPYFVNNQPVSKAVFDAAAKESSAVITQTPASPTTSTDFSNITGTKTIEYNTDGSAKYLSGGQPISEYAYNLKVAQSAAREAEFNRQSEERAKALGVTVTPQTSTSTSTTTVVTVEESNAVPTYEPTSISITAQNGTVAGYPTYTNVEVPLSVMATLQRSAELAGRGNVNTDLLNQISNEEVQKVLDAVNKIKQVLNLIISFTSLSDVASALIPNEIRELQKIVNPTVLIPYIKIILNLARGFNQIVQQILGYVTIAKTIVKVLQILITVMRIAIWVFRILPVPLMFATSGIMDGLVWARQLLDNILDNGEKILGQIGKLIDIIFEFCTVVSQILAEIIQQIEILLFTLEACLAVDIDGTTTGAYNMPSSIIQDLKSTKGSLQSSLNSVNDLTANYRNALANSNQKVFNGYTMEIQEEELFDASVRYKRRRAIAFDSNGILVEGTDLTFATDKTILFEELRLKLVNSGYIQDTGAFIPGLDFLADVLGTNANTPTLVNADTVAGRTNADLPTTKADIYASIGIIAPEGMDPEQMMRDEAAVIKKQLNAVISNIKGGDDLRKSSQSSVQQSNVNLKSNLKNGTTDKTSNPQITGGLESATTQTIYKGETVNPDILSDSEIKRLQAIKKSAEDNPQNEKLTKTNVYKVAVQKLEADAKARKE